MSRSFLHGIFRCALGLTPLAAVACGGTASTLSPSPDASADAAGSRGASTLPDASIDAGGGFAGCGSDSIAFDLSIGTTAPVFLGGTQPPWPTALWCPYWLTVTDPLGNPLVLRKDDCFLECPAFQTQAPTPQSMTWDGTYYPASLANDAAGCHVPACAVPGNYTATFCVGYAAPDAGAPEAGPPASSIRRANRSPSPGLRPLLPPPSP